MTRRGRQPTAAQVAKMAHLRLAELTHRADRAAASIVERRSPSVICDRTEVETVTGLVIAALARRGRKYTAAQLRKLIEFLHVGDTLAESSAPWPGEEPWVDPTPDWLTAGEPEPKKPRRVRNRLSPPKETENADT